MSVYDLSVKPIIPKPPVRTIWKTFRAIEFAIALVCGSFLVYFLTVNYGVSIAEVKGPSMEPTYHDMDKVLVNRFTLLFREPAKGEIVIVWQPGIDNGYDIKRVAACPGDIIETVDGGKTYNLGDNQYFVLGDNTNNSWDSRYYGPVHRVQIVGVVK